MYTALATVVFVFFSLLGPLWVLSQPCRSCSCVVSCHVFMKLFYEQIKWWRWSKNINYGANKAQMSRCIITQWTYHPDSSIHRSVLSGLPCELLVPLLIPPSTAAVASVSRPAPLPLPPPLSTSDCVLQQCEQFLQVQQIRFVTLGPLRHAGLWPANWPCPMLGLQPTGDHCVGKPSATQVSQIGQLSLSSFRGSINEK